jgi:DNA-binding FadR family transcriptional regulator
MRELIDRMRLVQNDAERFLPLDIELHREIALSSGNELLLLTMDALSELLYETRVVGWEGWLQSGHGPGPVHEAHSAVVDAIESGNAEAAMRTMEAHLDQARLGIERIGDADTTS